MRIGEQIIINRKRIISIPTKKKGLVFGNGKESAKMGYGVRMVIEHFRSHFSIGCAFSTMKGIGELRKIKILWRKKYEIN